jgi:hypothetical protein
MGSYIYTYATPRSRGPALTPDSSNRVANVGVVKDVRSRPISPFHVPRLGKFGLPTSLDLAVQAVQRFVLVCSDIFSALCNAGVLRKHSYSVLRLIGWHASLPSGHNCISGCGTWGIACILAACSSPVTGKEWPGTPSGRILS